jgi:two-component sensor histidine kinase
MGMKLMETLAAQLSGRLGFETSSKGTAVALTFPLVE